MVDVVTADLISGFLECILYGIFFVLSTTSLSLLILRYREAYGVLGRGGLGQACFLKKWLVLAWGLRRSPLIVANALLMITISAVRMTASDITLRI